MVFVRVILKIGILPLILIVRVFAALFYAFAWILSKIMGPLLIFIGICAVYSALVRNWRDVLILAACCGMVWGVFALAGILIGIMKTAGDSLQAVFSM